MEKITSELTGIRTAAIAGHVRPDGDCVGACMGLYLYLKENYPEIETDIYLESPKESLLFLQGDRRRLRLLIQKKKSMMCFSCWIPV